MRVAVSQIDTQAGDLAHTAERMAQMSATAAERGVDLLVFGVATLSGPTSFSHGLADAFEEDLSSTLTALAGRVSCDGLVPVVVFDGDDPAIEAMLLRDGTARPLRFVDVPASPLGEGEGGLPLVTFEAGGSRLGLAFCSEDLEAWCERSGGVDVLVYLAPYGYAIDDASSALGSALVEGRDVDDARELGSWLVAASSVGGYGGVVYPGSSFALDPKGRLV